MGLLERLGSLLSWAPRRLYRAVVIAEQRQARLADERHAALVEIRDRLGEAIVVERVSMGNDPRLIAIEAATARLNVLTVGADERLRAAVTAFCDELIAYRRKWSGNTDDDRKRLHDRFLEAREELVRVLGQER